MTNDEFVISLLARVAEAKEQHGNDWATGDAGLDLISDIAGLLEYVTPLPTDLIYEVSIGSYIIEDLSQEQVLSLFPYFSQVNLKVPDYKQYLTIHGTQCSVIGRSPIKDFLVITGSDGFTYTYKVRAHNAEEVREIFNSEAGQDCLSKSELAGPIRVFAWDNSYYHGLSTSPDVQVISLG